jgi:hypothetical protein
LIRLSSTESSQKFGNRLKSLLSHSGRFLLHVLRFLLRTLALLLLMILLLLLVPLLALLVVLLVIIGPIPLGRDVPEQTLREATAIADELIARRRPQGSHRGRAGAPTAPVNRYRPNEPIRNQREGLINEIINVLTTNPNAARQLRRGVR